MEENSLMPNFGDDDVLSFDINNQTIMYRIGKIRETVKKAFQESTQIPDTFSEFLKSQGLQIDIGTTYLPHSRTFRSNNPVWFNEGIECEALKIGAKGWQKGKIRIRINLEFCPDEPEVEESQATVQPDVTEPASPLDDLRRMMHENDNGKSI